MPKLSRYLIKTGLCYFVGGLLLSLMMMLQPILNVDSSVMTLRPVYIHWLTIGWLTQLIMGVAYWMFPKFSREQPRGNENLGWASYLLLNLGLILRSISEPLVVIRPEWGLGWMLALAALCLLLAAWLFVFNTWQRVKER